MSLCWRFTGGFDVMDYEYKLNREPGCAIIF